MSVHRDSKDTSQYIRNSSLGKKGNDKGLRVAHSGDLNSFFYDDEVVKAMFLAKMINTFDDNIVRYFVPEVNSSNRDLCSIVNDLKESGFRFI